MANNLEHSFDQNRGVETLDHKTSNLND